MFDPTSLLSPLLTFLSLELAAIGYLVNEVVDKPKESRWIEALSVTYGLSVTAGLGYITLGSFMDPPPYRILTIAGAMALASVFAIGAVLYTHQE